MDANAQQALVAGLVGIGLVLARRWKNDDPDAGAAVAGFTILVVIVNLV